MEGPFLVKSLWINLWNCAKRSARGAETLQRRRDAAWAKGVSAPQWMTLGGWYIVCNIESDILWHDLRCRTSERPSISYTIPTCDIERCLFDIEGMKPRYRQPYSWPSILKVCDHRYRIIRPLISYTFAIDIRYRRCKTSISNAHSISKSSIWNVTLDIERPTLDIGVARIQMTTSTIELERKVLTSESESDSESPWLAALQVQVQRNLSLYHGGP
jgi:hypothetical protein